MGQWVKKKLYRHYDSPENTVTADALVLHGTMASVQHGCSIFKYIAGLEQDSSISTANPLEIL